MRLVLDDESNAKLWQRNDYHAFGMHINQPVDGVPLPDLIGINDRYYNGKEFDDQTTWLDYGARQYDYSLGKWMAVDPLAEKTPNISIFAHTNNNPLNMIDPNGKYAVSVHYQITFDVLRDLGYSRKQADLIAHYSSTYADHPTTGAMFGDLLGHGAAASKVWHLIYREGVIDYSKTSESQDEKNSQWHSMMSDQEAASGMTQEQALKRGLKFGWDNIFDSNGGKDLGKLGQGLHALQDAHAHGGMQTESHLGANVSSFAQTVMVDMYGSTQKASNLTRSAVIVLELLQGKKSRLKDGDELNVTGMSGNQVQQVMNLLIKQGFQGTINFK